VNHEIPEPGVVCLPAFSIPDHKNRGDRQQLPEDEEGEHIARVDNAQTAAHGQEGHGVLPVVPDVEGVQGA
jgi:hypothetical protein